jgi:hypothetical protein
LMLSSSVSMTSPASSMPQSTFPRVRVIKDGHQCRVCTKDA